MSNVIVYKFDKNDIYFDESGIHMKIDKTLKKEIKTKCGIDINDQTILRHIYFSTVNGKVSFTVPNRLLKR